MPATISYRNLYYKKAGVLRLQGVTGFIKPGTVPSSVLACWHPQLCLCLPVSMPPSCCCAVLCVGMMICVLGAPDAGITTFFEVNQTRLLPRSLFLFDWSLLTRSFLVAGVDGPLQRRPPQRRAAD